MGLGHEHHGAGHGHEHQVAGDGHHGVGHERGAAGNRRRLRAAMGLTALYMLAEVVGGAVSNSLALLADAGHMFSDVAALGLSLTAVTWAQRPATAQRTYGFHRAEILAALINGAALLAVASLIVFEAFERMSAPEPVDAKVMLGIAAGGLVINLINLRILHGGKHESLNVRGAWLHVLADTMGSVGAISAGLVILFFGWTWADPVASVLIALLVLYSAWGLLRETLDVLMQSVPRHIDLQKVIGSLEALPGVRDAHDLHIWSLTSGRHIATVHLTADDGASSQELVRAACETLSEQFHIHHSTIQVETGESPLACNSCDGPSRIAS
jgi:cobalt-zinc-cadmium efflux system protein